MRTDAHARARITLACLAALAPSAPTVERIAMVADGEPYDGEHRLYYAANAPVECIVLRAPEVPVDSGYDGPRNRAERRAAANSTRRVRNGNGGVRSPGRRA
jgi:hypothetical protein